MRAPPIEWPLEFREVGPPADPSILLSGDVKIGNNSYVVTAVRMNENATRPDYRIGVSSRAYDFVFADIEDGLEFLLELMAPAMLQLSTGQYLLWIVPEDLG